MAALSAKLSFKKASPNVSFGSKFPVSGVSWSRPESGVKQSKLARTSAYRRKAAVIGLHSGRQGVAKFEMVPRKQNGAVSKGDQGTSAFLRRPLKRSHKDG